MPDKTSDLEVPLQSPYSQDGCFFCGKANPHGAQLEFSLAGNGEREVLCRWVPDRRFLGLGRVLHGGIQGGMFDEIMGWSAHHFSGNPGVTVELEVRYLAPLYIGNPLEMRCRVLEMDQRRVRMEAWISDHEGKVCARAQGSYAPMEEKKFFALVGVEE